MYFGGKDNRRIDTVYSVYWNNHTIDYHLHG